MEALKDEVLEGAPRIAFLGVYHAAAVNGQPQVQSLNVLGLSYFVPSFIYPFPITGMNVLVGIYNPHTLEGGRLRLLRPNGEEIFRIDVATKAAFSSVAGALAGQSGWMLAGTPVASENLIFEPGIYPVLLSDGRREQRVGAINFIPLEAPPLTPEEIEAIKLNPRALTGVQWRIVCRHCEGALKTYAAIERSPEVESEGYVWNRELPPEWTCPCGKTRADLSTARANLHGFLRGSAAQLPAGMLDLSALHRLAALEAMCVAFHALLERDPAEEEVHVFLDEHRLFFHPFGPLKVLNKARILAQRNCDFALLTSAGEFILIELERPNTKLLKKDGGMNAELQHAFDQVRSWLDTVMDHRSAVLEGLKLKPEQIGAIRGVVIAGRDSSYPPEQLRQFKRADHGAQFLTYDDLLRAMMSLTESLRNSEPTLRSGAK